MMMMIVQIGVTCRSREAVCHSSQLHRMDSASSAEQSSVERMIEDVSDAMQLPQFALRQDSDSRRPTAKVQVPQITYCTVSAVWWWMKKGWGQVAVGAGALGFLNNNNNNNPICKAPECQKTSVVLKDFRGASAPTLLTG